MSRFVRLQCFAHRGARAAAVLSALLLAFQAGAAPVCVESQHGIGGTGAVASSGAVGGTGAPQGAIGGTGAVAGGAIGGTGAPQGAIGGTGVQADGGIGGTGAPMADGIGGTGIVGTITGFASVCVNGLEIHYDDSTPVTTNGAASDAKQLAVGQVVAIEATPSARGLTARGIAVLHAVAGPITEVQPGQGLVRVMGQPVRVGDGTRIAGAGGSPTMDGLRPGMVVQVSGLRNSRGEVVASRIAETRDLREHSAVGRVQKLSDRGFDLNGTRA